MAAPDRTRMGNIVIFYIATYLRVKRAVVEKSEKNREKSAIRGKKRALLGGRPSGE
jgi:hypothetical protein